MAMARAVTLEFFPQGIYEHGRDFLDGFLHARSNEAVKRIAGILLVDLHHGSFGHAVEDAQVHLDLLKIGAEAGELRRKLEGKAAKYS